MTKKVFLKSLFLVFFLILLTACNSNNDEEVGTNPPEGSPINSDNTIVDQSDESNKDTDSEDIEQTKDNKNNEEDNQAINKEVSKKDFIVNRNHFKLENVETTDSDKKVVLLTIDDAPRNHEIVTSMLNTLDEYNAKAIWFVNGNQLVNGDGTYREVGVELLKEIHNRGHIVGNHTFSHPNLLSLANSGNISKIEEEVARTSDLIEEIIGERPVFFRHPFGAYNSTTVEIVEKHGMQHMNWSVGSLDWELTEPEDIVNQVTSTIHDGANILMHDLKHTSEALPDMLKQLENLGYEFALPTQVNIEE